MKAKLIVLMLTAVPLSCGFGAGLAADTLAVEEASPTKSQYLTGDTITGTVMRKEGILVRKQGEDYYIKDNDGVVQKIHIDKRTKVDRVLTGDLVKAYVTNEGHVTTIQRDN
ncbi:MAG: hypothetical protein QM706_06235 [Nitrospira sp.]